MKQLTCEMCGGTDLVKQEGVFVCQSCGTKYSIEEAKKMMVEGVVEVEGTVKVDNTDQIQNFIDLSQNAYKAGNGQSAFDYANKALEIQPNNPYAWMAKMKSIEYIATLGDLKLMEVYEAGKNAISGASEDEKEKIIEEVYSYELLRAMALLKLSMNKFNDNQNVKDTFKKMSRISLLKAPGATMQADAGNIKLFDSIAEEALALVKLIPDDVIAEYPEMVRVVGECAKQYQFVTNALEKRYDIYGAKLTPTAKQQRAKKKQELEMKADKAKKAISEKETKEKQARIDAYWADNQELKTKLESEKRELEQQIKELDSQIESLPENSTLKDLSSQLEAVKKEKEGLGLFKSKEKKALQEKIDDLERRRSEAQSSYDAAAGPLKDNLSQLKKRVSEIDEEFSKDRK
ncbi:MAG: hypothetical protein K6E58_02475 [Eubacterium sp.]|nr:hypothetical protein [Eubacterium sp.]